ncbi:hypothetical protein HDU98_002871 [Podochytrium sp. JEL0797]|nr:hypothetical protein HDU98_002871 [Podochytrium sp. JEL0797]
MAAVQTSPTSPRAVYASGIHRGTSLTPEQQLQIEELKTLKEEQSKLSFLLAEIQALPMPRSQSIATRPPTAVPAERDSSDAVSIKSASTASQLPDDSWTPEMVGEWVRQKGASEQIVQSFIEQDIDGSVLVTLSGEDLKNELGVISFGLRRKIMAAIDKVRTFA